MGALCLCARLSLIVAGMAHAQTGPPEHFIDIGADGDESHLVEGFYQREGPNEKSNWAFARENDFRWVTNEFVVELPVFPGKHNEIMLRMQFNGVLKLTAGKDWQREIIGLGTAHWDYVVVMGSDVVGQQTEMELRGEALNPARPGTRDRRTLYALVDSVRVRGYDEDPGTEMVWEEIMSEGPPIPVRDRLRGVEWRPASHDVTAFIARLKAEGANQVTIGALNGLGYANYPSEFAVHSPNMAPHWIPGVTKALRDEGLGILCWVPFNVQDLRNIDDFQMARLHPEWTMKFIDDPDRDYPPRIGMCVVSSPYIEWYAQVLREVASFDLDGIFFDGFYFGGIPHPSQPGCVCKWCRARFKEDTGLDLPEQVEWTDMTFKRWVRWRNERLLTVACYFRDEMQKVNPKLEVTINFNLWPFAMKDWETAIPMWRVKGLGCSQHAYSLAPEQEWMMLGFKARLGRDINPDLNDIWRGSQLPRNFQGTEEEIARHELRIRTFLLAGLTYGIKPWYGGPAEPPIGHEAHKAIALRERYFAREQIQHVAVLCSQNTHDFYGHVPGADNLSDYRDGLIGTWMCLTEQHVPFQFIFDNQLTAEQLEPYKVLVLPNAAALSDEAIEAIGQWVRKGGHLVATAETALYDEWGGKRAEPGLDALLRAPDAEKVEVPVVPDAAPPPISYVVRLGEGVVHPIPGDPGLAWTRNRDWKAAKFLLSAVRAVPAPVEVEAPTTLVVNTFRSPDGRELWVHMLNVSAFMPNGDTGFRGLGKPPAPREDQATDAAFAEGEGDQFPPLVPATDVKIRFRDWDVVLGRLVVAGAQLMPAEDGAFTVPVVEDHDTLVVELR